MHMKKESLLVITMLIIVLGCSTTKFTPVIGLEKEPVTSRSVPAKVSRESDKVLEKKGYAQIGFVYSDDKVKTCWGTDCSNFSCDLNIPHKDVTKEVVEKAAASGGDIVVLEKDSTPSIESTTKEGKCLSTLRTSYQDQECSGGYGNVPRICSWVTKYRETCTSIETIHGKACTFVSSGSVWRHDPEMGKRLAVILREFKVKERLENAEREKKENETKQLKSNIIALDKIYAEDSYMAEKEDLVSIKVDGKYGFRDRNGKMVIPPRFTDTDYGFSDGVAVVAIGEKKEKKWGIIDKTGKWILPPSDKTFQKFSDRMGIVYENQLCGYINTKGQAVIAPQFRSCSQFSDGFAAVIPVGSSKCGYVNKKGQTIIASQFTSCSEFSEGFASVKPDQSAKFGYIDKTGRMVIEPRFSTGRVFSSELAAVELDKKWGFIDKKGTVIIKPQFRNAYRFISGIAKVVGNDYLDIKYIDKTGKILLEPYKQ